MLCLVLLCMLLISNSAIKTKQLSNEEVEQCIEAKRAWQKCKKTFGDVCDSAGQCGTIRQVGALMVPANLSLTDQALWESSHHEK